MKAVFDTERDKSSKRNPDSGQATKNSKTQTTPLLLDIFSKSKSQISVFMEDTNE